MGVFLQVAGGITIAVGALLAVATVALATPLSMARDAIMAIIWFLSSLVSGCVLIALGQIHDRVTETWDWMRVQRSSPSSRPAAPAPPAMPPADQVAVAAPKDAPAADLSGSVAGRAALWAKYEQAIDQAAKKD